VNRRKFGTLAIAGLGSAAAAVTAVTAGPRSAQAATLVTGSNWKVKSVKGTDNKFYLLPSATVSVKPGSQIQFVYKGLDAQGKPSFDLQDAGTGTGTEAFALPINGTPSTSFATSPTAAVIVDAGGSHPIAVEQPPA
jgi:plastocyanin